MEFITISEAVKRFGKSQSTIKKLMKNAPNNHKKKGEKLNTGLHKTLISVGYLSTYLGEPSKPTINTRDNDYIDTLKNQLDNQQKTIEKLLNNQEQFLENERNFQILLERANQRADLLETHFNRNKKLNPQPKDEIIEDIIEERKEEKKEELSEDIIPSDRATFQEWLKKFNS